MGIRLLSTFAGVLLVPAVLAASDAAPVTSYPPEWPHGAPWKLNRELLHPGTERIVLVVDAPRGAAPKKEALDHLVHLAATYGQREARWVEPGALGAPAIRWIVPPGSLPSEAALAREFDGVPVSQDLKDSMRYLSEVPSCPDGPLPESTSYVFVRYVGQCANAYGLTTSVATEPSCGQRTVPIIFLAQERIARDRVPTMTRSYLESRALAHEYGHALGLASNPSHGRWGRTVPYRSGPHCINHACAVAVPTASALLKGQMLDYCADCRRDIEQAAEHWRTGRVFSEALHLPQPDPAQLVERLKARNFRLGGDADKLLGCGKAVVPALIGRLSELPGSSEESPRRYAIRLALKIITTEDTKRRGLTARDIRYLSPASDLTAEFTAWWNKESQRFMTGDQWELPGFVVAEQPANSRE